MPLTASFHGWSKASLHPAHGVYLQKRLHRQKDARSGHVVSGFDLNEKSERQIVRTRERSGAEDGIRTRDLLLGKEMLYR